MLIISHRVNTIKKLRETPEKYGVEIDVRAYGKNLILNHEPHRNGDKLEDYLKNYRHKFIMFDVKDAGVEQEVIELTRKYKISDYFLFNTESSFVFNAMTKLNMPKIAVRLSEHEPIEYVLTHAKKISWVLVDVFTKLPINKEKYNRIKKADFKLCLISPEQLDRPHDIKKYKSYFKKNGIVFDAVMCEDNKIGEWES